MKPAKSYLMQIYTLTGISKQSLDYRSKQK